MFLFYVSLLMETQIQAQAKTKKVCLFYEPDIVIWRNSWRWDWRHGITECTSSCMSSLESKRCCSILIRLQNYLNTIRGGLALALTHFPLLTASTPTSDFGPFAFAIWLWGDSVLEMPLLRKLYYKHSSLSYTTCDRSRHQAKLLLSVICIVNGRS